MRELSKEIIRSDRFDEQYTLIHHPSGLDVLVWRMEGFSSTEAFFATRYGSVNNRFKTRKTGDFIEVPEGIAHYLEHKLFENEDTDVFDLYAATGANANAYTSFDETAYTFSTTQNWEQALEILLDFVQKPYFTQENVDKEQGIIAQEIRMGEDNPERQCYFDLLKALYHVNPVRIDIAGTVDSIKLITPELLYDCYYTFYNLHNMVLSIAGNVDEDRVIEICDRLLKPAEDPGLEITFPEEPEEPAQKIVVKEAQVGLPVFELGFKGLPVSGEEFERDQTAALVCLHMLVGTASPLYQQLSKEGLVNTNFAFEVFASPGCFFSAIISGESRDPEEVMRRIFAEIERVKREGFDGELFDIIRKVRYASAVRSFNDVESCAESMMESYFSSTDAFRHLENISSLSREECERYLGEFFREDRAAISIVKPVRTEQGVTENG